MLLLIENRAAELFRAHGYPSVADHPFPDVAAFREMLAGHEAWVAVAGTADLAGYAVAGPLGRYLHLRELSVDPTYGRRGMGTALVRHVLAKAREGGHSGVTLTTFRDVPFNAPFYSRLGFEELPLESADEALRATFLQEVPEGIDASERLLMLRRS